MSESDPVFSIPATSLKQYGKKKRRRDEAQAARDEPVESGKKKKRKHDEESGDTTSPVVQRDLDLQGPLDVAEKKKKKKKKEEKRQHGAADDTSVPDEAHVSGVDATSGLEKKEKRKRDYTIPAAGAETGEEGDATGERKKKKKKKHHDAAAVDVEIGVQENEAVDTSTVALPSDAADPPVKKNKKSKEKRKDKVRLRRIREKTVI
ncbi:hypothetical protein C8R43DRAFT_395953 [Mycena crocata]|nr:hypothetical protein C8R43DRAFT_395953 [Mycena crocata]